MRGFSFISILVLVLPSFTPNSASATPITRHSDSDLWEYYTRYHSLGEDFQFDNREWQNVNVTDLSYKYNESSFTKRNPKTRSKESSHNPVGSAAQLFKGMKGIGNPEKVEITWYTGHDLLNPSCWTESAWAPTDNSFACALTLHGWVEQPKCFEFLELCNGPKKCVFVRVVDSCAGCAPGSKHVDLTKRAFSQLADLDKGAMNVQMRRANRPPTWFGELWGPQR